MFEKSVVFSYFCRVEADSLEEAKEYAEDSSNWEDDYEGEGEIIHYICKVYKDEKHEDYGSYDELLEDGDGFFSKLV